MVAHEKRNSAQLFCAVPTRNDLALSSLLFSAHPTQKLGYPRPGEWTARPHKGENGRIKGKLQFVRSLRGCGVLTCQSHG